MRKDLLLVLLASSTTGSMYGAGIVGGLEANDWTFSGVCTPDKNTGSDLVVPNVAAGAAVCNLGTLQPGTYKVNATLTNAVLTWTTTANPSVPQQEFTNGCFTLTAAQTVYLVLTSDDGQNGFSIENLNVTVQFDWAAAAKALNDALNDKDFPVLKTLNTNANTSATLKSDYNNIIALRDVTIPDEIASLEAAENQTIANYNKYKLYATPNSIKEQIDQLIESINTINPKIDAENARIVAEAANMVLIDGWRTEIAELQAALDALGVVTDNPATSNNADVKAAKAAQTAINDATKAIDKLLQAAPTAAFTDAQKQTASDAISAASTNVEAVKTIVIYQPNYDKVWGEKGLIADLDAAVKAQKIAAYDLMPTLQLQANDEIDNLYTAAKAALKITKDGKLSEASDVNLAADTQTINNAIAEINAVVGKYAAANQNVAQYNDQLNNDLTGAGGDDFANCRPYHKTNLQELQAKAEAAIEAYAEGFSGGEAAALKAAVETALDNLEALIATAKAEKAAYEAYAGDNGVITNLQKDFDSINEGLESTCKGLITEYPILDGVNIYDSFENSRVSVQNGITDLTKSNKKAYDKDEEYTADTENAELQINKTIASLNNAVTAYETACKAVIAAVEDFGTNQETAEAYAVAIKDGIDGLYACPLTSAQNELTAQKTNIQNLYNQIVKDQTYPTSLAGKLNKALTQGLSGQQLLNAVNNVNNEVLGMPQTLRKALATAVAEVFAADKTAITTGVTAALTKINGVVTTTTNAIDYLNTLSSTVNGTTLADVNTTGIDIANVGVAGEDYKGTDWQADQLASFVKDAIQQYANLQPSFENWCKMLKSGEDAATAIANNESNYKTYKNLISGNTVSNAQTANQAYINSVSNAAIKTVYQNQNDAYNTVYGNLVNGAKGDYEAFKIETEDGLLVVTNKGLDVDGYQANLLAAKQNITGFKALMVTNDTNYNKITGYTYDVNETASKYLASINESDPGDVTGVAAEINAQLKDLFVINNDVYTEYKAIEVNDNTYGTYEGRVIEIENKIKELYEAFNGEIGTANNNMLQNEKLPDMTWQVAYDKANAEFNNGALIYDDVYKITNATLKENINNTLNALVADYLPNYHTDLYRQYDVIRTNKSDIDDEVATCNKESKVIDAATVTAAIAELNGVANTIKTASTSLNNTVLGVIDSQFKTASIAAENAINDAKNALNAAITLTEDDETNKTIFWKAYQDVLSGPQSSYAAAIEEYQNTAKPYDVIDDVLDTLESIGAGINTGNVLKDTYNTYWTSCNNNEVANLTTEFKKCTDVVKQYEGKWNSLIDEINNLKKGWDALKEANCTSQFTTYVNDLQGKINDLKTLLTTVQDAQKAITGSETNYQKWNDTTLPGLNNQVEALEAYVNSLASAYTQASVIANIKADIESLDEKVNEAYDNHNLSDKFTFDNLSPISIGTAIAQCKLAACQEELNILRSGVADLYTAFNKAKVQAEANKVDPSVIDGWYDKIGKIDAEVTGLNNKYGSATKAPENTDEFVAVEEKIAELSSTLYDVAEWNAVDTDIMPVLDDQYKDITEAIASALEGVNYDYIKDEYQEDLDGCTSALEALQTAWLADKANGSLLLTYQNYVTKMDAISADVKAYTTAAQEDNAKETNTLANAKTLQNALDAVSSNISAAKASIEEYETGGSYAELLETYNSEVAPVQDAIKAGTANWAFGFQSTTDADYVSVMDDINTISQNVWNLRLYINNSAWKNLYWTVYYKRYDAQSVVNRSSGALREILRELFNKANTTYDTLESPYIYGTKWEIDENGDYVMVNQTYEEYIAVSEDQIDTITKLIAAYQDIIDTQSALVKGDVNIDKEIDVADYIELLLIILDQDKYDGLTELEKVAADINGDRNINIADLTSLKWIINHDGEETDAEDVNSAYAALRGDNSIRLINVGSEAGITRIGVYVDNAIEFAGMQFDINLGQGMEIVSEQLADRSSALDYFSHDNGNNHRVVLISQEDNMLSGNSGYVAFLDVRGDGDLTVSDAIGADARAHQFNLTSTGAATTGIDSIASDNLNGSMIFNIQGQMMTRMQKGINILRDAYGSVLKIFSK